MWEGGRKEMGANEGACKIGGFDIRQGKRVR